MARVALITLLALVAITTEALLTSRNDHYLSVGEFQVIPINSNPSIGDYTLLSLDLNVASLKRWSYIRRMY